MENPRKTPKTKPGEGYTRRVQGKKKLTTTVLEEELEVQQSRLRELEKENELLRMKEALQLVTLEGVEMALHRIGTAAEQAPPGSESRSEALLSAALLDMKALELKQILAAHSSGHQLEQQQQQPETDAAISPSTTNTPSTAAQDIIAGAFASPEAKLAVAKAAAAAISSDSGTSSSGVSGGSGGSNCDTSDEAGSDQGRRMQRLVESITPAEVQAASEWTLQELAGRLRDGVAKLALARQSVHQPNSGVTPADVAHAMEGYMRMCLLSLISHDDRHCVITGLNLESLQHEPPPEDLWADVARKANLQPSQIQHLTTAFQTYTEQQAALLQQQQAIMQQLQVLLGPAAPAGFGSDSPSVSADTDSSGSVLGAATAAAVAAGPAHFMSLATGGAVKGSLGQGPGAAGASAPAWLSGAAEVASQTQTRAAILKAKAAAPAAAAAATGAAGAVNGAGVPTSSSGGPSSAAFSDSSGSGSSSWLAPEGVLALEDADKAEQLLLEWQRVCHRMKRQARSLSSMVMNTLTIEQLTDATLAGYPYIIPGPKFCAHMVQLAQKQRRAPQR